MKSLLILFISLGCFFSPGVTAEGLSAGTSLRADIQEQPVEDTGTPEMRDILDLQRQVNEAEDRYFELFNELNNDDMYDIHCRIYAPLGTKIKRRECVPEFYDRLTADKAQSFLDRAIHGLDENKRVEVEGAISGSAVITHHLKILKQKMKELVKTNAELYNRITELHNLTEKLEEKRRIYYGRENNS